MADLLSLLDREVTVLVQRLRGFSASRWRAAAPPHENRADAAYQLAVRLAELGSAPVALPQLGEHVVADQIAVTGHDLVVAAPTDEVIELALDAIWRTREALGI